MPYEAWLLVCVVHDQMDQSETLIKLKAYHFYQYQLYSRISYEYEQAFGLGRKSPVFVVLLSRSSCLQALYLALHVSVNSFYDFIQWFSSPNFAADVCVNDQWTWNTMSITPITQFSNGKTKF